MNEARGFLETLSEFFKAEKEKLEEFQKKWHFYLGIIERLEKEGKLRYEERLIFFRLRHLTGLDGGTLSTYLYLILKLLTEYKEKIENAIKNKEF